eukprot:UN29363
MGYCYPNWENIICQCKKQMGHSRILTVGDVLALHCPKLEQQIMNRQYFYKSAKLVSEHIILVNDDTRRSHGSDDLVDCGISIDRRMVDYCVGLDTEFGNLVEGSLLYTPTIKLENVILPTKLKDTILAAVSNFDEVSKAMKKYHMNDIVSYGNGLCLLFHGMSGTGKTMFANALANHLRKKYW